MTGTAKVNILFVDDSPEEANLYADHFNQDPIIQPTTALSAEEGLTILAQSDIDCVVSDSVHTNNGDKLVTVAKQTYPDIPVLLHSGQSPDQLPTDIVDGFLQKGTETESSTALETLGERALTLARQKKQSTAPTRTGIDQRWQSLGTFDWTTQDSAATVIERLADHTGLHPMELGPLYDHIDPDALSRLMTHSASRQRGTATHVQFEISGYTVRMSSDGAVEYRENTD